MGVVPLINFAVNFRRICIFIITTTVFHIFLTKYTHMSHYIFFQNASVHWKLCNLTPFFYFKTFFSFEGEKQIALIFITIALSLLLANKRTCYCLFLANHICFSRSKQNFLANQIYRYVNKISSQHDLLNFHFGYNGKILWIKNFVLNRSD